MLPPYVAVGIRKHGFETEDETNDVSDEVTHHQEQGVLTDIRSRFVTLPNGASSTNGNSNSSNNSLEMSQLISQLQSGNASTARAALQHAYELNLFQLSSSCEAFAVQGGVRLVVEAVQTCDGRAFACGVGLIKQFAQHGCGHLVLQNGSTAILSDALKLNRCKEDAIGCAHDAARTCEILSCLPNCYAEWESTPIIESLCRRVSLPEGWPCQLSICATKALAAVCLAATNQKHSVRHDSDSSGIAKQICEVADFGDWIVSANDSLQMASGNGVNCIEFEVDQAKELVAAVLQLIQEVSMVFGDAVVQSIRTGPSINALGQLASLSGQTKHNSGDEELRATAVGLLAIASASMAGKDGQSTGGQNSNEDVLHALLVGTGVLEAMVDSLEFGNEKQRVQVMRALRSLCAIPSLYEGMKEAGILAISLKLLQDPSVPLQTLAAQTLITFASRNQLCRGDIREAGAFDLLGRVFLCCRPLFDDLRGHASASANDVEQNSASPGSSTLQRPIGDENDNLSPIKNGILELPHPAVEPLILCLHLTRLLVDTLSAVEACVRASVPQRLVFLLQSAFARLGKGKGKGKGNAQQSSQSAKNLLVLVVKEAGAALTSAILNVDFTDETMLRLWLEQGIQALLGIVEECTAAVPGARAVHFTDVELNDMPGANEFTALAEKDSYDAETDHVSFAEKHADVLWSDSNEDKDAYFRNSNVNKVLHATLTRILELANGQPLFLTKIFAERRNFKIFISCLENAAVPPHTIHTIVQLVHLAISQQSRLDDLARGGWASSLGRCLKIQMKLWGGPHNVSFRGDLPSKPAVSLLPLINCLHRFAVDGGPNIRSEALRTRCQLHLSLLAGGGRNAWIEVGRAAANLLRALLPVGDMSSLGLLLNTDFGPRLAFTCHLCWQRAHAVRVAKNPSTQITSHKMTEVKYSTTGDSTNFMNFGQDCSDLKEIMSVIAHFSSNRSLPLQFLLKFRLSMKSAGVFNTISEVLSGSDSDLRTAAVNCLHAIQQPLSGSNEDAHDHEAIGAGTASNGLPVTAGDTSLIPALVHVLNASHEDDWDLRTSTFTMLGNLLHRNGDLAAKVLKLCDPECTLAVHVSNAIQAIHAEIHGTPKSTKCDAWVSGVWIAIGKLIAQALHLIDQGVGADVECNDTTTKDSSTNGQTITSSQQIISAILLHDACVHQATNIVAIVCPGSLSSFSLDSSLELVASSAICSWVALLLRKQNFSLDFCPDKHLISVLDSFALDITALIGTISESRSKSVKLPSLTSSSNYLKEVLCSKDGVPGASANFRIIRPSLFTTAKPRACDSFISEAVHLISQTLVLPRLGPLLLHCQDCLMDSKSPDWLKLKRSDATAPHMPRDMPMHRLHQWRSTLSTPEANQELDISLRHSDSLISPAAACIIAALSCRCIRYLQHRVKHCVLLVMSDAHVTDWLLTPRKANMLEQSKPSGAFKFKELQGSPPISRLLSLLDCKFMSANKDSQFLVPVSTLEDHVHVLHAVAALCHSDATRGRTSMLYSMPTVDAVCGCLVQFAGLQLDPSTASSTVQAGLLASLESLSMLLQVAHSNGEESLLTLIMQLQHLGAGAVVSCLFLQQAYKCQDVLATLPSVEEIRYKALLSFKNDNTQVSMLQYTKMDFIPPAILEAWGLGGESPDDESRLSITLGIAFSPGVRVDHALQIACAMFFRVMWQPRQQYELMTSEGSSKDFDIPGPASTCQALFVSPSLLSAIAVACHPAATLISPMVKAELGFAVAGLAAHAHTPVLEMLQVSGVSASVLSLVQPPSPSDECLLAGMKAIASLSKSENIAQRYVKAGALSVISEWCSARPSQFGSLANSYFNIDYSGDDGHAGNSSASKDSIEQKHLQVHGDWLDALRIRCAAMQCAFSLSSRPQIAKMMATSSLPESVLRETRLFLGYSKPFHICRVSSPNAGQGHLLERVTAEVDFLSRLTGLYGLRALRVMSENAEVCSHILNAKKTSVGEDGFVHLLASWMAHTNFLVQSTSVCILHNAMRVDQSTLSKCVKENDLVPKALVTTMKLIADGYFAVGRSNLFLMEQSMQQLSESLKMSIKQKPNQRQEYQSTDRSSLHFEAEDVIWCSHQLMKGVQTNPSTQYCRSVLDLRKANAWLLQRRRTQRTSESNNSKQLIGAAPPIVLAGDIEEEGSSSNQEDREGRVSKRIRQSASLGTDLPVVSSGSTGGDIYMTAAFGAAAKVCKIPKQADVPYPCNQILFPGFLSRFVQRTQVVLNQPVHHRSLFQSAASMVSEWQMISPFPHCTESWLPTVALNECIFCDMDADVQLLLMDTPDAILLSLCSSLGAMAIVRNQNTEGGWPAQSPTLQNVSLSSHPFLEALDNADIVNSVTDVLVRISGLWRDRSTAMSSASSSIKEPTDPDLGTGLALPPIDIQWSEAAIATHCLSILLQLWQGSASRTQRALLSGNLTGVCSLAIPCSWMWLKNSSLKPSPLLRSNAIFTPPYSCRTFKPASTDSLLGACLDVLACCIRCLPSVALLFVKAPFSPPEYLSIGQARDERVAAVLQMHAEPSQAVVPKGTTAHGQWQTVMLQEEWSVLNTCVRVSQSCSLSTASSAGASASRSHLLAACTSIIAACCSRRTLDSAIPWDAILSTVDKVLANFGKADRWLLEPGSHCVESAFGAASDLRSSALLSTVLHPRLLKMMAGLMSAGPVTVSESAFRSMTMSILLACRHNSASPGSQDDEDEGGHEEFGEFAHADLDEDVHRNLHAATVPAASLLLFWKEVGQALPVCSAHLTSPIPSLCLSAMHFFIAILSGASPATSGPRDPRNEVPVQLRRLALSVLPFKHISLVMQHPDRRLRLAAAALLTNAQLPCPLLSQSLLASRREAGSALVNAHSSSEDPRRDGAERQAGFALLHNASHHPVTMDRIVKASRAPSNLG